MRRSCGAMALPNKDAGSPGDSPAVAALKEQKARIDLENQIAKARHDRDADDATAAEARLRGRFGQIAGSNFAKGDTTVDAGAGTAEATFIAARALDAAADRIAAAIATVEPPSGAAALDWVLFAGTQRPTLGNWRLFGIRRALLEAAFDDASAKLAEAVAAIPARAHDDTRTIIGAALTGVTAAAVPALAPLASGAGIALDLAAKIGSYLASDYKVSPLTVGGLDDDLLAVAVAGRLKNLSYPARWAASGGIEAVTELLAPLQRRHHGSLRTVLHARDMAQALIDRAKTDLPNAKALQKASATFLEAVDLFTAAQKGYDDLLAALAVADPAGVSWIARVIDEHAVADALDKGGNPLFVHLNLASGGSYTEKNLFTAFGSIPLHVMGGVIASYAAIHGASGVVLAAGQVPVHGGYHRLDEVAGTFGKRWGHRD